MPQDPWDKILKAEDAGTNRTKGTYGEARQKTPSKPIPRPKGGMFGRLFTMPETPKPQIPHQDYAPKGGVSPRGDLGAMSEHERKMFFKRSIKNAGTTLSGTQHLPYRKPAIAGGEGPHAA